MAQSSVSLYGALDLGYSSAEYLKADASQVKRTGYAMGANDTSRWGITGVEDIGGGMKAEFKIESQIGQHPRAGLGGYGVTTAGASSVTDYSYTNGTPEKGNGYTLDTTVIGNRELWIGLSQGNTTVKAGYGVTALRNLGVETNAAQSNNYGNPIADIVGGIRRAGVRIDQAYGPVTASAGIFGNDQQSQVSTASTGELRVAKGYTANVQYKQGPINAGIGYDQARSSNAQLTATGLGTGFALNTTATQAGVVAAADATVKTTMAGASYDLGVAKLFGQTFQQKVIQEGQASTVVNAGSWSGNSVGVRVPFGALTAFGQYFSGKNKVNVATTTGESRAWTGESIGIKYDLSKRTYGYVNTGFMKTEASVGAGADNTKFKQTSAGVVHYF